MIANAGGIQCGVLECEEKAGLQERDVIIALSSELEPKPRDDWREKAAWLIRLLVTVHFEYVLS